MCIVFGILSDWILANKYLSIPTTAKLFECIGFGMPALALGMMGFFTDNFPLCIAILTIGFGMRGGVYSGHVKNVLLLSPKFSGISKAHWRVF